MTKLIYFILFCCCTYASDSFQWQDDNKQNNLKLKKNNNLLPSIKKQIPQASSRAPLSRSLIEDSFFSDMDDMHGLHQKVRAMQNQMFQQMQHAMNSQSSASSSLMSNSLGLNDNVKFINKNDYLIVQIPTRSRSIEDYTLSLSRNILQVKKENNTRTSSNNGNSSSSMSSFSSSMRSIALPIIPKNISNQMIAQGKLIVTLKK
ncbi:MAG: hypothetical protein KC646_11465 [Candidatus Cloacimonetes bacterium]|nr:hypothetical protein [Candidatus Cloacimonadota bacterium]